MLALLLLAVIASAAVTGCSSHVVKPNYDPWESFNRKIFWFNDTLDVYVLEPVASGWDTIAPNAVQRSLSNFFANLDVPLTVVHNVLQGKTRHAFSDAARFTVNTTAGMGGFLDPASSWGLDKHEEDFGQTLAVWGVAPGPYLVLPVFGPSNPRDAVGFLVDSAPMTAVSFFIPTGVTPASTTVDIVNKRSLYLDEIESAKRSALDYYISVRDAYAQWRNALVADNNKSGAGVEDDLYYLDEEEPED